MDQETDGQAVTTGRCVCFAVKLTYACVKTVTAADAYALAGAWSF